MTFRTFPPQPGCVLRDQILNHRHIRQADLARTMGVSAVTISHIVNGHSPITAAMAVRLGHATRTKPEYWLELQSKFDLFQARQRLAPTLKKLPRVADGNDEEALRRPQAYSGTRGAADFLR